MDFWETWTFGDLLAEPVRNGIYKKKEFHGRGHKIINMGDLFSYDFISRQETKRIELNDRELANNLVQDVTCCLLVVPLYSKDLENALLWFSHLKIQRLNRRSFELDLIRKELTHVFTIICFDRLKDVP